ncbi:MAG TPA: glutamine-hydrolyzing GMP synthase, partial [Methylomirabilota bacterium]|nr:glutamine-hydrolyzing GMP synthase [Methylomirabilota bacterium]
MTSKIVILDFGGQYTQLIARRVRELGVYSEILPCTDPVERVLAGGYAGVVLSGGPSSVYEEGAPALDPGILELGVPVMGICYGFQAMAKALGGEVAQTGLREYGGTEVEVCAAGVLLDGTPENQTTWMSHGDAVHRAPEGFEVLATSSGSPVAAFEDRERRLYGVQWHPEVKHS